MNFLVPPGTSTGTASVTVWNGAVPQTARELIATVAPGLFTFNAKGLAAAYVVRVSASGQQTEQPVFTLQNGNPVALPIDLGPAGAQVYLILLGTGIRNASAAQISVTINGLNAQVNSAGPDSDLTDSIR